MGYPDTTFNISWGYDELMLNCLCGMVDQWKALSLISSSDYCQRFSPSQISDRPQARFKPALNLNSGFVEESCAVVMTTMMDEWK